MARNKLGHGSEPRITAKDNTLIDAILNGRATDIHTAMKATGLTERGVYKALGREHFVNELHTRARRQLKGFALPRALQTLHKNLDAESEYVSQQAAQYIAGVYGVRPAPEGVAAAGAASMRPIVLNRFVVQPGASINMVQGQAAVNIPTIDAGTVAIEHQPRNANPSGETDEP